MSLKHGIERLENCMRQGIEEEAYPGISYAIVTRDWVHLNHLGDKAWFPTRMPLSRKTIYDVASLTKVVATTPAIMRLIEMGEIRLVDSVKYYLPQFRHEGIRIFHLLTHTSGLPADIPRAFTLRTKEEVLEKVFATELMNPIGEKIVYSDIGYILLGLIIETVTGQTLDVFVTEHLFKPLAMADTGFNPLEPSRCAPTELREDEVYNGYLQGIVHDEKAFAMGGVSGHAGLFSTNEDLAKFIQMVLNDGFYHGQKILSKSSIDQWFIPKVMEKRSSFGQPYSRSLGWELPSFGFSCGDLVSGETIYHTGFTGTSLIIDRGHGLGMVFLTNHVHPKRGKNKLFSYRQRFANIVLGEILPFLNE